VVSCERSASMAARMAFKSSAVAREAAQPATLTSINLRTSKSCRIDVWAARPARSGPGGARKSVSATTTPRPARATSPRTAKDFSASRMVVRPTLYTEQRLRSDDSRSPGLILPWIIFSWRSVAILSTRLLNSIIGQAKISLTG
jgi:hypothetical protein